MSEEGYGTFNQNSNLQSLYATTHEELVTLLSKPRVPLQVVSIIPSQEKPGYVAFFRSNVKLVRMTISRGGEAAQGSV